ncbi:OsmC family protein [Gordonia hydrophobica]|uniref:OsmC family protein n=1 Tax=Gordonia hydrophobica TaxID=40516 RepID=A0ABZ2U7Q3_9ACTN|nr:OsmC family protein [Gordonia hydrophobica]MBM7368700.1 organic hydroperoxide reductase OsmC/OhrA [Gordonia hydrophobica]
MQNSGSGGLQAEATVEWSGWGGRVRGAGGELDVATASQVELGGPGGGTNPEELLAATLANCFSSEFNAVVRARALPVSSVRTRVRTTLGVVDGRHRIVAAAMDIVVTSTAPSIDVEAAARSAADDCPVCAVLRPTVPVVVSVYVVEEGEGKDIHEL